MAEANKPNADNAAKTKKLQSDLDKMKKVAKKLLQKNQKQDKQIKAFEQENESLKQNISGIETNLTQSREIQSQLENAMENKNQLITTLEQKISHKDETAALQDTTSQQIIQELDKKCGQYEQEISQIKTEKEALQQSMTQSVSNRQEIDEKDAERAKTLKSQMKQMTEMMSKIQNENSEKITELEQKLAISQQRIREKETINNKYLALKEAFTQEQQRSESLMQLNGALKKNVMGLHSEKEELEENLDEIKEKYMEIMNDKHTNTTPKAAIHTPKNEKFLELQRKTLGFKQSIEGLKKDMSAIAVGFREELLNSTTGLANIHAQQMQEKNKYISEIQRLKKMSSEYEEYRLRNEQTITELKQTNAHINEEKETLQQLYNTVHTDCQSMEQHLSGVQSEFDTYKSDMKEMKESLLNQYNAKEREKDKLYDLNLSKAVQQNESLKAQISKMSNEFEVCNNEKMDVCKKYNDLCKINEENVQKLNENKSQIEELLCNNQNMQEQIVRIKTESTETENDSLTKQLKRTQTPLRKHSMDFSTEIHKQLKDENMEKQSKIEQLQNEMVTVNEKYNQSLQTIEKITAEKQTISAKLSKHSQHLKTAMQKLKQYKASHIKLTQSNTDMTAKYNELQSANEALNGKMKELQVVNERNSTKLKEMSSEHTSSLERNQILQMENEEMKKQNRGFKDRVGELQQNIKMSETQHLAQIEKTKSKYKAYITKQKQSLNQSTHKLEALQGMETQFTELQSKHETLAKEYESKAVMANEKSEIQNRYQTLSNDYEVCKSDLEQSIGAKTELEQKMSEMEKAHKESFAKYKEKAKSVVNKHKNNATKQINDMKQQLLQTSTDNETLTQKISELNADISAHEQTKSAFEQSMTDLNAKLRTQQTDLDRLAKQIVSLKSTNDDLEKRMQSQRDSAHALKADTAQMSLALFECSFFKSDAPQLMSIVEGINKLTQNYEDMSIKHSERESQTSDHQLKVKEQSDKIKRLAVTVRKLQNVRTKLQTSLESTKKKLNDTSHKSDQFHKSLQTIHSEIQRSLEKWKAFITASHDDITVSQTVAEANNETDEEYLKRCLTDVRSLSMYFIQALDMYREKNEQCISGTKEFETDLKTAKQEIEAYKKDLLDKNRHIESTDNSQIAKNAHIEKLTEKLNHSIACISDNWHYDITKADFVDLSVSTRLVLEDTIWCLIRWRHKLADIPQTSPDENSGSPKKKYNDEYFWTSQATYLSKLNVKENEIYLPDFFENKLENQITKNLESKWKAIQRRTERQIQELKSQKSEEEKSQQKSEKQFKEYKAKAKVILQKQKDELSAANQEIKALNECRAQVTKLKQELSEVSTENWAEKYREIEEVSNKQKTEFQNKKLECAEIQSKLLLRERKLSILSKEFEREKEEIRSEFETENLNSKKKYAKKLDDYRVRAREMLQEKDKQLSIVRTRLKNTGSVSPRMSGNVSVTPQREWVLKYDKETQTDMPYTDYEYDNYDNYYENDEQKYQQQNEEEIVMDNNKQIITTTDDLIAALQPPLNATLTKNSEVTETSKDEMVLEESKNDEWNVSNIAAMARVQSMRDQKLREFGDRLRRLQELLNHSEEECKSKEGELQYFRNKFEQIEQAKDIQKSADNSEYLKHALLQYFEGKININQLVSVASVGLRFNSEEQKQAQNSKLIIEKQSGISGYVKSWWQ